MNGGYLYPVRDNGRRGSREIETESCECLCPPNFSGKECERRVDGRYYDAIDPLICGGVINATDSDFNDNEISSVRRKSILIQTLGYPGPRKSSVSCSWIINVCIQSENERAN